ncbi:hypothetical protein [Scandinavium goeteborgense]|nr:hypothetical protein [Scandinavium goeteborgense]
MKDGVAVISVNNINVGSMPVEQYEEIVRTIKKDWRTRILSVLSYMRFGCRIAIRLWSFFVQSFSVIIALFMLYSIFNLPDVTQYINEVRNLPSQNIAEGIRLVANLCVTLMFIVFPISIFIKGVPVFVSATENAINKKIREIMEVPSEGKVSVSIRENGSVVDVR